MTKVMMALVAVVMVPVAASAESWDVTGPRGGTATGSISCGHGDQTLSCNRTGILTTPGARAVDRAATRVTDSGGTIKTITSTGAGGRSVTVTRTRVRGN